MEVFRNTIIAVLNFFKKLPFYLSVILIAILIIFEASDIETLNQYLIRIILVLFVSLLYFDILYYFINKTFFFKIINPIGLIKFYNSKGKLYLKKQIKEVFVEEILFKYLTFLLFGSLINDCNWIIIILTAIVFTYIHKFNSLFSLIEFSLFFATCHYFFLETHIFAILFLPHLLRNLIIEYLTRIDNDNKRIYRHTRI